MDRIFPELFKAWFKSKTADKVLSPIREAIIDRVNDGSDLLDVGCGTGDLLFRAEGKIHYGLGVDLDPSMIRFAQMRKAKRKADKLEFSQTDIGEPGALPKRTFAISTSTLCLHEMRASEAVSVLQLMAEVSSKILIADYARPEHFLAGFSIELDEMISGHYGRFRQYRNNGYLPQLARQAGLDIVNTWSTPIDGILIWELTP